MGQHTYHQFCLPVVVCDVLEQHPQLYELLEVVMDLGRPPLARFPSGDVRLSQTPVSTEDIEYAIDQVWCIARLQECLQQCL